MVRRSDEAAVAHGALPNNGGAAVVQGLVAALAWRGRVQEGARVQLKAKRDLDVHARGWSGDHGGEHGVRKRRIAHNGLAQSRLW